MITLPVIILTLLSILVTFGLGFAAARYYAGRRNDADLKDNAEFIRWLRTYETWYTRSVTWISWTVRVCRIAPIIIGFFIAIISVYEANELPSWLPHQKILIITLTAFSTACVALLTQFSLPELEKERETGRRECARLVACARLFFSVERPDPEEVLNRKREIKERLFKIEEEQSKLYYDLTSTASRSASLSSERQNASS
jgi:hypothetical protein